MKITAIEELSKARSRVWIDGEFAFVLYKGELRLYRIREGEEISEETLKTIRQEVLPKRAKLRAMNLLKSREYTTKQLHDKLKQGGYPENIITLALDYVASYHYTDDLRYAVSYMQSHETDKSRRRIEQDLMRKGIGKETLEKAWQTWEARGGEQDEQQMISELLEKRGYCPREADLREKQRLYGFLMRRGFSGEQVRKALGDIY
mgnify:CR=1 FL=1